MDRHLSPTRAITVRAVTLGVTGSAVSAGAAVALALTAVRSWQQLPAGIPIRLDDGLHLLATTIAACVCGWLAMLLVLGAWASSTAPTRSRTWPTPVVGRVAAVLLALAAGSPAATAAETPQDRIVIAAAAGHSPEADVGIAGSAHPPEPAASTAGAEQPREQSVDQAPVPGWRPAHPPPTPVAAAVELVSRGAETADTVVVVAGDTLWDIAARHLGSAASIERIAAEWPRWHQANLEVIGDNPDLILPGQILVPPEPTAADGAGR